MPTSEAANPAFSALIAGYAFLVVAVCVGAIREVVRRVARYNLSKSEVLVLSLVLSLATVQAAAWLYGVPPADAMDASFDTWIRASGGYSVIKAIVDSKRARTVQAVDTERAPPV